PVLLLCAPFVISCLVATTSTQIFIPSLHDALPIYPSVIIVAILTGIKLKDFSGNYRAIFVPVFASMSLAAVCRMHLHILGQRLRSEEHTSELQSRENLVCRLLLEKKKKHKRFR